MTATLLCCSRTLPAQRNREDACSGKHSTPRLLTWRFGECVDPALCTKGPTPSAGAAESCREHAELCSDVQRCRGACSGAGEVQESAAQRGARCREVWSGAVVQRGAALPRCRTVPWCGEALWRSSGGDAVRHTGPSASTAAVRRSRVHDPIASTVHAFGSRKESPCVCGHRESRAGSGAEGQAAQCEQQRRHTRADSGRVDWRRSSGAIGSAHLYGRATSRGVVARVWTGA